MYLTQPLHKALRECPEATATVFGERRQTYSQFAGRVARVAGALGAIDVAAGDRVAMLSLNSDRYLEYVYGVLWAGAVINPINIRWSAREIAYSLDDCDCAVLLIDDTFLPLLDELRERSASLSTMIYVGQSDCPDGLLDYESLLAEAAEVADAHRSGDDLAAVLYTGGTTGMPKGVMLSHRNLYSNALGAVAVSARPPHAVGLHAAPMFHVAGIGLTFQLASRLSTQVIISAFEPGAVLEAIERESVNETFLVPTMLRMVLDHPKFAQYDLSSLKYMLYGASPIDSTLLSRALEALPQASFMQLYGMTELSPVVTQLPAWCHTAEGRKAGKLTSAGEPINIAELRTVDENDEDVATGVIGEIVARGPMVMQGYWNKPEQTAEALKGGWMHTGDAGYMDEDGFVFVVDRMKDMVVTGGENVYSVEVEDAIMQWPQVAECAVIGIPDEQWGERVHAVLVLREGEILDEAGLTAHCKELISSYKTPRSFECRDAMPLSGAGKLLKYKLREPHWEGQSRKVG